MARERDNKGRYVPQVHIGDRYGKLLVKRKVRQPNGSVKWECLCECGNTTLVLGSSLRKGDTKSCGCAKRDTNKNLRKDITGNRYGKLVAIERDENHSGAGSFWKCKCDCGNVTTVHLSKLTTGHTKSCGCSRRNVGKDKRSNLRGQRFGKLTAIDFYKNDKHIYWRCVCDCGTLIDVLAGDLANGHTKSCGCMKYKTKEDLAGERFGKLVAIRKIGVKNGASIWECQCDCGNKTKVKRDNLTSGNTKSCGCDKYGHGGKTIHGMTGTRIFRVWSGMIQRCSDTNAKNYGGRGISVCDEWKNAFQNFYDWAMANGYSDDLTIDRINNDGNYEPSNCRWATAKEQANNKRNNHYITINGAKHTLKEWAEIANVPYTRVCNWARAYDDARVAEKIKEFI